MKIGYLTKRRDACHWLRVLNPMSYLNSMGHDCHDEIFEKQVLCNFCHSQGKQCGPYEVQYDHQGDVHCPVCHQVMMTGQEFVEWNQAIDKLMEEKDIIAFQRPTDLSHIKLIRKANAMGKKTVQICDDDYLNVPEWNSGYRYYKDRKGFIEQSLREVTALDVTTPYLVDLYKNHNKKIGLMPNSLDMDLIEVTPAMSDLSVYNRQGQKLSTEFFEEQRAGKKFFLWGGSPTHEKDLEIIVGAMRRLVRSENICLGLVGYVHRAFLEVIPHNQLFLFSLIPCAQYFMTYKAIKADFGLAPVAEVDFNRGKSPLKALEYQAIDVLPIMSDFVTYQNCSPKGFYAKNDEYEWFKTMRSAIHCGDSSERIAENKKYVTEHYNMKNNCHLWEEFYGSL